MKTNYITRDGWEFDDAVEAEKHEDELTRKEENAKRIVTLKSGKQLSHDEIVEYFNSVRCDTCPFCNECDKMYSRIRMSTTNTFSLCTAVKGKLDEEDFEW